MKIILWKTVNNVYLIKLFINSQYKFYINFEVNIQVEHKNHNVILLHRSIKFLNLYFL